MLSPAWRFTRSMSTGNARAVTASRNNILLQKQIVAQQLADQTAADEKAKEAVVDANEANARQLEAMQGGLNRSAQHSNLVAKMECGHEAATSHLLFCSSAV